MKFENYRPGDGYDYHIFYGIPEQWPNPEILVVAVVRMGKGYVGFIDKKDFQQQNRLEIQQRLLDVYGWPLEIADVVWSFLNDKAFMANCPRWECIFPDTGKQNLLSGEQEIIHIQSPEELDFQEPEETA